MAIFVGEKCIPGIRLKDALQSNSADKLDMMRESTLAQL